MVYLITYERNKGSQNNDDICAAITKSSNGIWYQILESAWMIQSDLSVEQIYKNVKAAIDDNDHFFVIEVSNNKQGWLSKDVWTYLNSKFFN